MNVTESEIREILLKYKQMTVYGLSPNPDKASQAIPLFMQEEGYDIVGIYPGQQEIAGFKIYEKLNDVPPDYRKFVDVFQRSENIPRVVEEVLAVGGVEVLWLQLGITHPEAERRAEVAGIKVISNRCLKIEFRKHIS